MPFRQGIKARKGVSFEFLIRIEYRDGHRMLTIGGMVSDEECRDILRKNGNELSFLAEGEDGGVIEIPRVVFTRKELMHLEAHFPDGIVRFNGCGVSKAEADMLRKFYRYWPVYGELIV